MRLLGLLGIIGILGYASPVYAYPEYPPFEQTQFSKSYGTFRWWESCWWRVIDPYIYVLCGENGQVSLVYPDGSVVPASDADLDRLFVAEGVFNAPRTSIRWTEGRLTVAPGDGYPLSDLYGTLPNFSVPHSSFDDRYSSLGTGVFQFDGVGNFLGSVGGGNNGTQRIFGGDVPTSSNTTTGIFDRTENRFSGTQTSDLFHKPTGLLGCTDINDFADGGIFGPIPCTSYPGVFGPKVHY